MTLTEQLYEGTLPTGWYYINSSYYANGSLIWCEGGIFIASDNVVPTERITEVLAPVPSYEEWQASEKYNKHLEEVIKIYERKDKQATETSIAYNELLEENHQLKELLKEVEDYLPEFETPMDILAKIDEALK